MGGEPVSALNLVAFPLEKLGVEVLGEILRGGQDVATAAGCAIVGGHSIDDAEPKYGLAVTGTVHPDEILTNAGGRAGDVLVLTKPLGAGAITTAAKRGIAKPDLDRARRRGHDDAEPRRRRRRPRGGRARAMTDVTGFGLLGHLHELALASGVAAEVDARAVPAIDGVTRLLAVGERAIAGGTKRNRAYAETFTTWEGGVAPAARWLLCDAMTSGGLLVAVAEDRAAEVPGPVDRPPRRGRARHDHRASDRGQTGTPGTAARSARGARARSRGACRARSARTARPSPRGRRPATPPASTSSSKNFSKPAGEMISRIRAGSSPAFQNVCHWPRGLKTKSPASA